MATRTIGINAAANISQVPRSLMWSVMAALNQNATLGTELIADHATSKTALDAIETLIEELHDDSGTRNTWETEVDADLDVINNYLDAKAEPDGVIGGDFNIVAGANVTLTGSGHVQYRINGIVHYVLLDTTISLVDDGDVDAGKWRAWRIEINRLGVVTCTADGDTQHNEEELAMLNLSTLAQTANTVTIGYFNIDSNGGYAVNDVNVNGETAENVYVVRGPLKQVSGLHAALGGSIAIGSTNTKFSHGTVDAMLNGQFITQLAAGTDVTFDDADIITSSGQFGGHLIVLSLGGGSVYALASDGLAGAASTMTHATAAAANTALDTIADQLPENFAVIGRITVESAKSTFTYATDDLAGTDGTGTYTDATVGTWDRTDTAGFDSHQINPPAIPATVSAPVTAAVGSSKPASGPGTLSASAPDDFATRELGTPS